MRKDRKFLKPFSKGWYRATLDEYLQSPFLQGLSTASEYMYAAEECEKIRMENEARRKVREYKRKVKEAEKGISKTECFQYFKELSVKDPVKYDKVLSMLGIEPGTSLYAILFKGGKQYE